MATFTLLITVPDADAPALAADLSDHVQKVLEEGACGWKPVTFARVNAMRGDYLNHDRGACRLISVMQQTDHPDHYRR